MAGVLILGAGSDVAISLAYVLAEKGYDIHLAARNSNKLNPIKSDIQIRFGITCSITNFDAEKFDSHSTFINSFVEIPELTICCFGYLGDQQLAEVNFTEAFKIININFSGAVSVLNLIASKYIEKREGTIIGISSVAGDRGRSSNYLYGSAKAGFTTYLSGLRNRLCQENVHVITVLPGFISSKMTAHLKLPGGITASPSEVANVIVKAYFKKRNVIYVKWFWRWIMFIIKQIPEFIFKKLKL